MSLTDLIRRYENFHVSSESQQIYQQLLSSSPFSLPPSSSSSSSLSSSSSSASAITSSSATTSSSLISAVSISPKQAEEEEATKTNAEAGEDNREKGGEREHNNNEGTRTSEEATPTLSVLSILSTDDNGPREGEPLAATTTTSTTTVAAAAADFDGSFVSDHLSRSPLTYPVCPRTSDYEYPDWEVDPREMLDRDGCGDGTDDPMELTTAMFDQMAVSPSPASDPSPHMPYIC